MEGTGRRSCCFRSDLIKFDSERCPEGSYRKWHRSWFRTQGPGLLSHACRRCTDGGVVCIAPWADAVPVPRWILPTRNTKAGWLWKPSIFQLSNISRWFVAIFFFSTTGRFSKTLAWRNGWFSKPSRLRAPYKVPRCSAAVIGNVAVTVYGTAKSLPSNTQFWQPN
jgi:hypothetical protein